MEYVSISTPPGEYNLTHKDPKRRKFATYLFYLQEWVYNFADGCNIYYRGFIYLYSFVYAVWLYQTDPFYVDGHSEIADAIVGYKFNYILLGTTGGFYDWLTVRLVMLYIGLD